ncbi:LacI family DNA-binding transcriptional regulator [Nonomuraea phyllanthi]|uniref:LacI family DNA-binding transcriptional regulator n=1 Tax=Nonomuraea phyllanthi TaxID=2219224 RepID=A0A5C4W782_9ACTN|nr:LacI family DNA-binding transcriptional regulator [Nonomuraea phyllanthi]QFY14731.1 LacI family DNA-binding transcriptional regulator [Nonomuraea phyllanthi]
MTLQQVATAAGVSLATASRVLNGSARVRPELRDRVEAAASELAYTPNAHAQALVRASWQTVGIISHDVSDPYFSGIARGAMRAAAERDLPVMMASTFRDPEREIAYISMLRAQRARAILLIGSGFEDRRWERAMDAELGPYLSAGGRVAVVSRHRSLRVDTVLPQNRQGAAALARSLLSLGHRRFAVLSGPARLSTVVDRVGGFQRALAEAGVPAAEVVEAPFSREGGHRATTALLSRGLDSTCLFATTDVMAVGALAALREHGVRVPEDVSLAGFDDISVVRDLTPPLTTVALPLEEMGERVVALALRDHSRGRRRIERMAGTVVLRASTARLPAPQ